MAKHIKCNLLPSWRIRYGKPIQLFVVPSDDSKLRSNNCKRCDELHYCAWLYVPPTVYCMVENQLFIEHYNVEPSNCLKQYVNKFVH